MRWIGCCILAVVAWKSALLLAQDQGDDAHARDQVVALEKAWNQAYKVGDVKALDAILDNALVLVEDDGTLKTKTEFLATLRSASGYPVSVNEEQIAPESLSVRVFGNTAIAVGVIAVKSLKHGKPVVLRERFIDTWVKRGMQWVCVATDATPMTRTGP